MPPKKITVAVLAGGSSAERGISLKSGTEVAKACRKLGYKVVRFDPAKDLPKFIQQSKKIDVVFPALHGRGGEDGTIQGLLEFLQVPYVGSGMSGMIVSFDKRAGKSLYKQAKLPVAKDFIASKKDKKAFEQAWKKIGKPAFVKPVTEGSSYGASIVRKKSELLPALKKAWKFGDALVEEFIDGTEITVAVLHSPRGLMALPVVEICSKNAFFDFKSKYDPKLCEEIVPARISKRLTQKAQDLAMKAHTALGLRDISRTDMLIREGRFYLLETNTIPGMTKASLFPKAARAAGISFVDLIGVLISWALRG